MRQRLVALRAVTVTLRTALQRSVLPQGTFERKLNRVELFRFLLGTPVLCIPQPIIL